LAVDLIINFKYLNTFYGFCILYVIFAGISNI